jgi:WD40 repeat protein
MAHFSPRLQDGVFSCHTSTIAGCSVAHTLDVVVTVAFDRSVRFWRLSDGVVLETVRDAHAAPITCCALTPHAACLAAGLDMLLATGGSDNLVKVWRRGSDLSTGSAECVYTLSGHYDAVKSVVFDPQAVFLVSAGDDANVITWRVRPSSPDAPCVPVVEKIDRFAITISWNEPLANGARISHYVVRTTQLNAQSAAGSTLRPVPDTQVASKYTSTTIDKLQPGVQYSLQLAAVNSVR